MPLTAGSQFASYEVGSLLGSGGMGDVYRARDTRLGRQVAIKVLRQDSASNPDRLSRFEREARAASALNHPSIVTIYDIGTAESIPYIVMEFVEGRTLRQLLEAGPLPVRQLLDVAAQIAEGLSKAHAGGIVHRDLKPENLMVTDEGLVKILDFGLAKLTHDPSELGSQTMERQTAAGVLLGTMQYMSPEQAKSPAIDHRSDQFSLGLILYEMATGRPAFKRDSAAGTLAAIMLEEPDPPARLNPRLPVALQQIISRCLKKDPPARYDSTADLARELQEARKQPSRVADRAEAGASPTVDPSIAVLPFVDMSPEQDQEYFCDGMAEEIINALTRIEGLRVASRTSAFQFKGRHEDVGSIGRRLGVGTLLEGSLRKAGDRIRVAAHLTAVADGYQLWSSQYDRDMKDVFAVQDEIASSILAALRIRLGASSGAPLVPASTGAPNAYKLFLKGRHHWNKRTEEGLKKGVDFFRQAVEEDPSYARAYAGLADSYVLLGIYGLVAPGEVMPKATAAATRALDMDGSLAEVHAALGCVRALHDWSWRDAERHFKRSIELDPRYATGHQWYATNYLILLKRFDEATAELKLAQELDPLSLPINTSLGLVAYFEGRFEEAAREYENALEVEPDFAMAHFFLGQAYVQMSLVDKALPAFEEASRLSGGAAEIRAGLGHAYGSAGQTQKARLMLEELSERRKQRYVSAALLAQVSVGLGEQDAALAWLEQACTERATDLAWIGVRPVFDALRREPRFAALIDKMGLNPGR